MLPCKLSINVTPLYVVGWSRNMRRAGGGAGRRPPPRYAESSQDELPAWMREEAVEEPPDRVPTHLTNDFREKAKAQFVASVVAANAARGLKANVKKRRPSGLPVASGLTGRLVLSTSLNEKYHDDAKAFTDVSLFEGKSLTLEGHNELIIHEGEIWVSLSDSKNRVVQSCRVTYGPLGLGPDGNYLLVSSDQQLKVKVHSTSEGNFAIESLTLGPPNVDEMPSMMTLTGKKVQTKVGSSNFEGPPGLFDESMPARQINTPEFTPTQRHSGRGRTASDDGMQRMKLSNRGLSQGAYQPKKKNLQPQESLQSSTDESQAQTHIPSSSGQAVQPAHPAPQVPRPPKMQQSQQPQAAQDSPQQQLPPVEEKEETTPQLPKEPSVSLQESPLPLRVRAPAPPATPATRPATAIAPVEDDPSLPGVWVEAWTQDAGLPKPYWFRVEGVLQAATGDISWKRPPNVIPLPPEPVPPAAPAPADRSPRSQPTPRPLLASRQKTSAAFELSAPFSKRLTKQGVTPNLSVSSVVALPQYAALIAEAQQSEASADDKKPLDAQFAHLAKILRSLLERTSPSALSKQDLYQLQTNGTAAVEGEMFERLVELVAAAIESGHSLEAVTRSLAPDSAIAEFGKMTVVGPAVVSRTEEPSSIPPLPVIGAPSSPRGGSHALRALPQPGQCALLQRRGQKQGHPSVTQRAATNKGLFVLQSQQASLSPRPPEPIVPTLGLAAIVAEHGSVKSNPKTVFQDL